MGASLKKMRFSIILFFAFIGFALTAPLQSDDKSDVATKNDIDGTVKKEDNKGEAVKEDSDSMVVIVDVDDDETDLDKPIEKKNDEAKAKTGSKHSQKKGAKKKKKKLTKGKKGPKKKKKKKKKS